VPERDFNGKMTAGAECAHGNALPFHFRRLANLWLHPKLVRQNLHQPCKNHDICSAARGARYRPDAIRG